MSKFDRVLQIGFDLAIPIGVTTAQVETFAEEIQNKINEGNELKLACLNGTNDASDLTHAYDIDDLNQIYKSTKYIQYSLDIRQSEIENTEKFVAEIPIDQDIREYVEEEASTYYGGDVEVESDGWYFESGCVCVHSPRFQEITEDEYNILRKFL